MPISARVYRPGRPAEDVPDVTEIGELLAADGGLLVWLDVLDPTDAEFETLEDELGLHPLAVEDCKHRHQRPKIEVFPGHLFIVVYEIDPPVERELPARDVSAFVGHRYLVTVRHGDRPALTAAAARWEARPDLLEHQAGFLAYVLLDEVVDGYFPLIDDFDERIDRLEDEVFDEKVDLVAVNRRIFAMKRTLAAFRQKVVPLRDIMATVVRRDLEFVPEKVVPYFQDVYDHLIRVTDAIEVERDALAGALDSSLGVQNNRMNDVMKKTSSWGAILLVATIITGYYGMNFTGQVLPFTDRRWGLVLVTASIVISTLVLYWYFKRRNWL